MVHPKSALAQQAIARLSAPAREKRGDKAFALIAGGKPKRQKYGNHKVTVAGETFDSAKESRQVAQLRLRERAGEIRDLKTQVSFDLTVNGHLVCRYVADATFIETANGGPETFVVLDVKSEATRTNRAYRIKLKLMKAVHNIEIREV